MSNPATLAVWEPFAACVLGIAVAGTKRARYGAIIAERTGLSGGWVGLVLLATATSLPELIAGINSVTLANAPNITVGNVLGACVFNLSGLMIVDLVHRSESVYRRAHQGHALPAAFGVALIGFVGMGLFLAQKIDLPALGHVGFYTPVIIAFYFVAVRSIFRYEKAQMPEYVGEVSERHAEISLRRAIFGYLMASIFVVGAGVGLPFVAGELAENMGRSSFVGTFIVAAATTLPEMTVTLGVLQLGAIDMAVANLLGSNLFHIAIIAVDDLFYLAGPILHRGAGPWHIGLVRGDYARPRHHRAVRPSREAGIRDYRVGQLGALALYVLNALGLYSISE